MPAPFLAKTEHTEKKNRKLKLYNLWEWETMQNLTSKLKQQQIDKSCKKYIKNNYTINQITEI